MKFDFLANGITTSPAPLCPEKARQSAQALAEDSRREREAQWRVGNREAIADYNTSVAAHGSYGDSVRIF